MKKNRMIIYFILVILFTLFNFYYRPVSGNKLVTKEYRESVAYVNDLYKSDERFKESLLETDQYHVYEMMMKDIKEGIARLEITCEGDCSGSFANAYYALYLDHPELISFQGATAYEENNMLRMIFQPIAYKFF